MDDGFQNPALAKDLSLLVVDGGFGLGNGRGLPAGPLREPMEWALARADAVILMGQDEAGVVRRLGDKPMLQARIEPLNASALRGIAVFAFAGIGRPAQFFRSLEDAGARIVARRPFPDHHSYDEATLEALAAEAKALGAQLVTTAKDAVRLPRPWRDRVAVLEIEVAWQDPAALAAWLDRLPRREVRRG
jgi:tetraacyldisaccharide 4'-kinase